MAKRSAAMQAPGRTYGRRGCLPARSAWAGHPAVSRKTHKTRQSYTAYNQVMLRKVIIILLTLAAVGVVLLHVIRPSCVHPVRGLVVICGDGMYVRVAGHQGAPHVCVPFWCLGVLFGIYPMLALIRGPLRHCCRRRKDCCRNCGYNLTGNTSGVCPECGTEITERRSSGFARCLVLLAVWLFVICLAGSLLAPQLARIPYPQAIDWAVLTLIPVGAFHAAKYSRHGVVFTLYGALASCVFWLLFFGNRAAGQCDALGLAYMIAQACLVTVALVASCRFATVLRPRWDARRRHPEGHCQACGYDLTGNVSGTCPECGLQ